MNLTIKLLVPLFCLSFLASCAPVPVLPPNYTYGEDAIRIITNTDPQLNLYSGEPHTLLICAYQLDSRNEFNQLAGDQDGLYKLLECDRFGSSVRQVERLIVRPNQKTTHTLDRAEGTRYVAVVAGYPVTREDDMVRVQDIPVVVESKGSFKKTKNSVLQTLDFDLVLGPNRIHN